MPYTLRSAPATEDEARVMHHEDVEQCGHPNRGRIHDGHAPESSPHRIRCAPPTPLVIAHHAQRSVDIPAQNTPKRQPFTQHPATLLCVPARLRSAPPVLLSHARNRSERTLGHTSPTKMASSCHMTAKPPHHPALQRTP
ncbi:hypothetical protein HYPSUDRAFT_201795 [Hypholoma sublateritium FD-334 SS-4]|uniref:Uncharacterized protein n=1 Tax=Hypholoma sublateritium (strain FD-334 SS-4) TaxID=945553 RepID=A0A0D2MH86_HYPSF|nr:hypothetical protein HYPSUDRAFT_201795 [Hypholoma sublateritium FD-334 SS-4]